MNCLLILLLIVPLYVAENYNSSATISYTLWVGTLPVNGTVLIHNINFTAPNNASFYHVMELAAKQNNNYKFKAESFDFGHYITEIGRWHEIPSLKYHWMIYKLPNLPDPWILPSDDFLTPKGVDETFIKPGDHYLFWFHKLKLLEHV